MGLARRTDKHEYHEVRCAECGKRETIRVPEGKLMEDKRFNDNNEYRCEKCR